MHTARKPLSSTINFNHHNNMFLPLSASLVTQARGVSFDVVFGQLLGTTALVCLWPLFLSFLPYRALRKLFPPIVTGVSTDMLHRECCATGTHDNCVCVCVQHLPPAAAIQLSAI